MAEVLGMIKFGAAAIFRGGNREPSDAELDAAPDDIRYTTLGPVEFGILRRFEFERCLRSTYEQALTENVQLLQQTPAFAGLPEATLRRSGLRHRWCG